MTDRDLRFSDDTPETVFQAQTLAQPTPQAVQQPILQPSQIPPQDIASQQQNSFHDKVGRLHLFTSFCEMPTHVSFQTQEQDEEVLIFLRRSQILNLPWMLMTGILLVLPFILIFARGFFMGLIPSVRVLFLLFPVYYLIVLTYAFVHFISWYYNASLITNKRVIDIDFHQLVFKNVAETKLSLVQDVSYRQVGVLQNMFDFGHILIQTAGSLDNFEFNGMPKPERVVEVVENLIGGKRVL